jgi:hypothetical protein
LFDGDGDGGVGMGTVVVVVVEWREAACELAVMCHTIHVTAIILVNPAGIACNKSCGIPGIPGIKLIPSPIGIM